MYTGKQFLVFALLINIQVVKRLWIHRSEQSETNCVSPCGFLCSVKRQNHMPIEWGYSLVNTIGHSSSSSKHNNTEKRHTVNNIAPKSDKTLEGITTIFKTFQNLSDVIWTSLGEICPTPNQVIVFPYCIYWCSGNIVAIILFEVEWLK